MRSTVGAIARWILPVVFAAALLSPAAAEEIVLPKPKPSVEAATSAPPLGALLEGGVMEDLPPSAMPYAPAAPLGTGLPDTGTEGVLYMVAKLTEEGEPLSSGLVWRVYSETINTQGKLDLVATAAGGDAEFRLDPGTYLVHTSFGHAGTTTRVVVRPGVKSQTVVLNAGGVKLDAELSQDMPLPMDAVLFDIYDTTFDNTGERRLVAANVRPGSIVRLNADTYHVVSRYGSVNAVVRADIRIEPGKLTEATLYHNAANITLKLVNQEGGEALADTAWSVTTPSGDVVVEGNGAFPTFVLASGDYQVVAKNHGELFSRDFTVEGGQHREVEVLARKDN